MITNTDNIFDHEQILDSLLTPINFICEINNTKIFLGNQQSAGSPPDRWNYTDDQINDFLIDLKKLEIDTIICCADGIEVFPNVITYYQVPARDSEKFDYLPYFDDAIEFVHRKLGQSTGILFHCNAGSSRSATLLTAFLMLEKKISLKKALTIIQNKRNCVNVSNFIKQLMQYEKTIFNKN